MQKRLFETPTIYLCDFKLDDDFPINCDGHIQKHQDLNQLHYHHILEIGYCIEGTGLFFINNQVHSFQKGDISIILPHQPHIAHSPNEAPSQWIFISVDLERIFIDDRHLVNLFLTNKEAIPNLISSSQAIEHAKVLELIIDEFEHKEKDHQLIIRHLLSTLLIKLLRFQGDLQQTNNVLYFNELSTISPALQYIQLHYQEDIPICDLAKLCNLSVTHFRVIFKKATTLSPLQYVTDVRMKMAKTLLQSTELPILTIAQNVGYNSISSFNRTFKELYDMTPSDYRKVKTY